MGGDSPNANARYLLPAMMFIFMTIALSLCFNTYPQSRRRLPNWLSEPFYGKTIKLVAKKVTTNNRTRQTGKVLLRTAKAGGAVGGVVATALTPAIYPVIGGLALTAILANGEKDLNIKKDRSTMLKTGIASRNKIHLHIYYTNEKMQTIYGFKIGAGKFRPDLKCRARNPSVITFIENTVRQKEACPRCTCKAQAKASCTLCGGAGEVKLFRKRNGKPWYVATVQFDDNDTIDRYIYLQGEEAPTLAREFFKELDRCHYKHPHKENGIKICGHGCEKYWQNKFDVSA